MEDLERANVTVKQHQQIKSLVEVHVDIFNDETNRDPKYYLSPNLYDNFVDFTKLPPHETLSKDIKAILYRPDKMKVLKECYDRLCMLLVSNYHRDMTEEKNIKKESSKRLHWEARYPRKPEEEYQWLARIAKRVETFKPSLETPEAPFTDPKINVNLDPKEFDKSFL